MKLKQKHVWVCSECGSKQNKWVGQCPGCKEWNTYHEEVDFTAQKGKFLSETSDYNKPILLSEVKEKCVPRMKTGYEEFDRLMGGGIVRGSLTLIGGEPGIGKSTLTLQVANALAKSGHTVLYVTGEESAQQTSLRARRLDASASGLYLLAETNFERIKAAVDDLKPSFLVIDSIQVIYKSDIPSAPGSVTQVRENTSEIMHLCKGLDIATFLIGHVTKSGEIAGPRVLEHLVDVVLYFEGDRQQQFRMVRVQKNRFGSTDEIAVFQMRSAGLEEVSNPSQIFLEERVKKAVGSSVIATLEGTRPILIEAQSLVSKTVYPNPTRRIAGYDQMRLALILAVLEKRLRYPLYNNDVFVAIAGGLKVADPGADLGILLACASSFRNQPICFETVVVGEVGLSGEIRSVPRMESRVKEAVHMGFKKCILPKKSVKGIAKNLVEQITLIGCASVDEAVEIAVR